MIFVCKRDAFSYGDNMKKVEDVVKNNAKVVAERNGRPGLDFRMRSYIECIDHNGKQVLLGGLGALGVGKMWSNYESLDEYKNHPGFEGAPTVQEYEQWVKDNPGNFGPCPRKTT